jgi:hypothetical protein
LATNFDALLDNITEHIVNQIWEGSPEGFVEGILITPKEAGHYIIEIHPPATWTHNDGSAKLLFAFENLYCVGFESNSNWFIFSDHYGSMAPNLVQGTNLRPLSISGNYNRLGPTFVRVNLSLFAFLEMYKAVKGYPGTQIKLPLRNSAVCFSETLRYPRFRQHIVTRLRTGACDMEDLTKYAEHFLDWSFYSVKVRNGSEDFVPIPDLDLHSFNDLQNFISMVL